jgi:hypothetical protein
LQKLDDSSADCMLAAALLEVVRLSSGKFLATLSATRVLNPALAEGVAACWRGQSQL